MALTAFGVTLLIWALWVVGAMVYLYFTGTPDD